jgi:hypothetical protein
VRDAGETVVSPSPHQRGRFARTKVETICSIALLTVGASALLLGLVLTFEISHDAPETCSQMDTPSQATSADGGQRLGYFPISTICEWTGADITPIEEQVDPNWNVTAEVYGGAALVALGTAGIAITRRNTPPQRA